MNIIPEAVLLLPPPTVEPTKEEILHLPPPIIDKQPEAVFI